MNMKYLDMDLINCVLGAIIFSMSMMYFTFRDAFWVNVFLMGLFGLGLFFYSADRFLKGSSPA